MERPFENSFDKQQKLEASFGAIAHANLMQPRKSVVLVEFDGHRFDLQMMQNMPFIFETLYRARRGDEAALAVVNVTKPQLIDANRKQYWPMIVEAKPAVGEVS